MDEKLNPKPAKARALFRRAVGLATHPALHDFLGRDRIDAIATFINNSLILKLRQRRARAGAEARDDDSKAYLRTRFCPRPFNTMETTHTGKVFVCCPVYLPTPIGNLDQDHRELWHSRIAHDIRESIIDGSYRYCDHNICPFIAGRTLDSRDSLYAQQLIEAHRAGREAPIPRLQVVLSHDKSCNLACPSCRSGIYAANKARQANLDALTGTSLLAMLGDADHVIITGSGDAFGSNHFRNLIKRITTGDFPNLEIQLHTNGQLFDERAWNDLKLEGHVGQVHISIDAATAETYAFVRRPGNFARLLKNLAFMRSLRARGEISHLMFSMVVQSRNFREMPAFVKMGEEYGADLVSFNMIRQRDIFSRDEYDEAFIGDSRHPDYREFLSVLRAPELASPRASLGNVPGFAPPGWLSAETPARAAE